MRRSRHVIAVIVVATALSADRAVSAAPQAKPHVTNYARSLASKLSTGLRRAVPAVTFVEHRRDEVSPQVTEDMPTEVGRPAVHAVQGSPFQFRLPPPTV